MQKKYLIIMFSSLCVQAAQKGVIGITLVTSWFVPISNAKHNRNAALRALDFVLGW